MIWLALAVNLAATIPQLAQIIRTGEAGDFNKNSIYLSLIANVLIGLESFRTKHWAMVALSSWFIVYWLVILSYKPETF